MEAAQQSARRKGYAARWGSDLFINRYDLDDLVDFNPYYEDGAQFDNSEGLEADIEATTAESAEELVLKYDEDYGMRNSLSFYQTYNHDRMSLRRVYLAKTVTWFLNEPFIKVNYSGMRSPGMVYYSFVWISFPGVI